MALLKNPEMIILDEPMNGLDPSGIVSIRKLLENLCVKNKITIVISSHILSELELLADVFYLIQNGKIIDKQNHKNTSHYKEADIIHAVKYFSALHFPNFFHSSPIFSI